MSTERSGIGPESRRGIQPAELPSPAEAKSTSGPTNDSKGGKDGDVLPDHEFTLDYKDSRGLRWQGAFQCHVLTVGERIRAGLTRATLAGNAPLGALDQQTAFLLEMLSWLALALDSAPEWAKDLRLVRDQGVVSAIYAEVAQHEARFWGADPK